MQYRRPVGTGERLQADNLRCGFWDVAQAARPVAQADSLRHG